MGLERTYFNSEDPSLISFGLESSRTVKVTEWPAKQIWAMASKAQFSFFLSKGQYLKWGSDSLNFRRSFNYFVEVAEQLAQKARFSS